MYVCMYTNTGICVYTARLTHANIQHGQRMPIYSTVNACQYTARLTARPTHANIVQEYANIVQEYARYSYIYINILGISCILSTFFAIYIYLYCVIALYIYTV